MGIRRVEPQFSLVNLGRCNQLQVQQLGHRVQLVVVLYLVTLEEVIRR